MPYDPQPLNAELQGPFENLLKDAKLTYSHEEDYKAVVEYVLPRSRTMENLETEIKSIEGVRLFYKSIPSRQTSYRQNICYYAEPLGDTLFQFNAFVEGCGLVRRIYLTIYNSIDVMREDMISELELVRRSKCDSREEISMRDFLIDFYS